MINCQGKVLITDLRASGYGPMRGGRLHVGSVTIRVLPEARPFYLVVLDIMGVEGYEILKPERNPGFRLDTIITRRINGPPFSKLP